MNKQTFIKKYKAMTEAERDSVKAYWRDIYKGARFPETQKIAEQRLLWMREV